MHVVIMMLFTGWLPIVYDESRVDIFHSARTTTTQDPPKIRLSVFFVHSPLYDAPQLETGISLKLFNQTTHAIYVVSFLGFLSSLLPTSHKLEFFNFSHN